MPKARQQGVDIGGVLGFLIDLHGIGLEGDGGMGKPRSVLDPDNGGKFLADHAPGLAARLNQHGGDFGLSDLACPSAPRMRLKGAAFETIISRTPLR